MNKELLDFISAFKFKDKLYDRVLKRHFKDNADSVIKELVDNEYFKETVAYKCPNCNLPIFYEMEDTAFDYIENNGGICYNCDTEITLNNFIKESVWIRTNKPIKIPKNTEPHIIVWHIEDILESSTRGEREGTVITFQCMKPLKFINDSIYVGYQKEDKWFVFKVTYRTKTTSNIVYKARFIGLRYYKHDPFDDDLKNMNFVNITDETVIKEAENDARCN